jgi:hypothetical protein
MSCLLHLSRELRLAAVADAMLRPTEALIEATVEVTGTTTGADAGGDA